MSINSCLAKNDSVVRISSDKSNKNLRDGGKGFSEVFGFATMLNFPGSGLSLQLTQTPAIEYISNPVQITFITKGIVGAKPCAAVSKQYVLKIE